MISIHRSKRSDKGAQEIPIKLLVMALLVGLIMPFSVMGYRDVSRVRFQEHVRRELYDVVALSRSISREGNLSSSVIEIDLNGDIFSQVGYVEIGDVLGGDDWMIRYMMEWEDSEDLITVIDPVVHLTSHVNDTFRLTSGSHEIKLTNIIISGRNFVVLSEVESYIDTSIFN